MGKGDTVQRVMLRFRGFELTGCVVLAVMMAGCATNPATGERQLSLISRDQEIAMGREAAASVKQTLGLVAADDLQAYVARVGSQLARSSERPDLPWEFHVVDSPVPNAFALPGGFIYVTRGLITLITSEAQLATVLGHEIGHVTARHSVNQISKQQLAQLGLGLGSVLVPDVRPFQSLLGAGLGLLFLKYSRDDERQADELGFDYIRNAHYDISQFDDVFRALERSSEGEQGAVPQWLATHPAPGERVETAEKRIAAAGPQPNARVGRDTYLRHIDGVVYGDDPRDGFFRSGVFYHPRLRFQLEFPGAWKTSNSPEAVVAVSPQSRAVVQLTLTAEADAQRALARFFAQADVSPGQSSATSIHGQPATIATFQAQTGSQVIAGTAAFIESRGRTCQLVGYASISDYARFAPLFERTIRSFAPLTDPELLEVQPKRVDIIELTRQLSVAEFADRYDSGTPAQELAIINDQPTVETQLDAGTLVKRIVG